MAKQKDFSDSTEFFSTSQSLSTDSSNFSKHVTIQENPNVIKPKTKLKDGKKTNHKPSKYHYHLKMDQIYGDKTLKICGQCTRPSNLANDLRFLDKNMRRSKSFGEEELNNIEEEISLHQTNHSLPSHQTNHLKLNKLNTRDLFDLHRSSLQTLNANKFDIDFDVIDLTTERQSGPNLPIVNLPPDLFKFVQLKRLHLDCNHIRVLPDLLGENLINLEILTLSNNCLKTLPESISNLKKLTSFHLSSNQLVNFPSVLCRLESLRFLDLCSNELTALDPNIGALKYLESLLLFHNRISELPPQIGRLTKLRTLWLGENKLTKLPREFTNLKLLEWDDESFNLSSNIDRNYLLNEPPLEVCLKGFSSIVEYFDSKKVESPKTTNKHPKESETNKSNNSKKTPLLKTDRTDKKPHQ